MQRKACILFTGPCNCVVGSETDTNTISILLSFSLLPPTRPLCNVVEIMLTKFASSDRSSYSDSVLLDIDTAAFWDFEHFCQYILFFLFENWMQIDNNWPWTSLSPFLSFLSLFLSFSDWGLRTGEREMRNEDSLYMRLASLSPSGASKILKNPQKLKKSSKAKLHCSFVQVVPAWWFPFVGAYLQSFSVHFLSNGGRLFPGNGH